MAERQKSRGGCCFGSLPPSGSTRRAHGLSQMELARKAGVDPAYVSALERGGATPRS
ncbi:MAG: helix-turn-helix transcriptional regulator [Frankiaceae bacterium]|nr:helix-turn-helix transcriptional regulator [Frankiaceae bacterium]MBV9871773.1 helix-turn-helix transcriptional regulator [Frankiaceae bacterium]